MNHRIQPLIRHLSYLGGPILWFMIPIFSHASSKKSCVSQHSSAASSVLRTPSSRLLLLPGAATTPARKTAPFVGSKTALSSPARDVVLQTAGPHLGHGHLASQSAGIAGISDVFPAHFPWKLAVDVWKHADLRWKAVDIRWTYVEMVWNCQGNWKFAGGSQKLEGARWHSDIQPIPTGYPKGCRSLLEAMILCSRSRI